jgi:hypothetical protein
LLLESAPPETEAFSNGILADSAYQGIDPYNSSRTKVRPTLFFALFNAARQTP